MSLGLWSILACAVAAARAPLPPPDNQLYFDRAITEADVRGKTLRELSLLRNTIYARAGNVFRKKWLHDHFTAQPWYAETGLDDSKLSALDQQNAAFLDAYEKRVPQAELRARYDALIARRGQGTVRPLLQGRLVLSPRGDLLAVLDHRGVSLHALSGETLAEWPAAAGDDPDHADLAFAADDQHLLWAHHATDISTEARVERLARDGTRQTLLRVPPLGERWSSWVKMEPDGQGVLLWGHDQLQRWSLTEARPRWARALRGEVLAVSRDHFLVDTGRQLELRRLDTGERDAARILPDWSTHSDARSAAFLVHPASRLALSPDGTYLAAALDSAVVEWDLVQGREQVRWAQVARERTPPSPHLDPRFLVEDPLEELVAGEGSRDTLAYSGDGRLLLVAHGSALSAHSAWTGLARWRQERSAELDPAVQLTPSADGRRLAWQVPGEHVSLWDVRTGAPVPEWSGAAWTTEEEVEIGLLARALGLPSPVGRDQDRTPLDDLSQLEAQLTLPQLRDLSRRDLMLLRNTIAARRGKPYPGTMGSYFSRMAWYRADAGYTEARLTPLDRRNLALIGSLEQTLGGPLPDDPDRPLPSFRARMLG